MTKIPWFVSSSSTWFSLEALGVTIDTLCSPYITFGGPNLRLRTYGPGGGVRCGGRCAALADFKIELHAVYAEKNLPNKTLTDLSKQRLIGTMAWPELGEPFMEINCMLETH